MLICKRTLHYKVWRLTHFFSGEWGEYKNLPERTNLCAYFSRTILMPIPVGLALGALAVLTVIVLVIGNAITILSGTGLYAIGGEREGTRYFPALTFGARRVSVRAIVLSSYGLLLIATTTYFYPWKVLVFTGSLVGGVGALVLLCIIGVAVCDGFRRGRRWDGLALLKQYMKAKKQRVCPLITFDEPDDHSTTTSIPRH